MHQCRRARGFFKDLDEALKSKQPYVQRLVGTEGSYFEELGLLTSYFSLCRILLTSCNYGESTSANVGSEIRLKIPRGLNQLWSAGGIHTRTSDHVLECCPAPKFSLQPDLGQIPHPRWRVIQYWTRGLSA